MMRVVVYINDRKIAEARALNISELAAESNYDCCLVENSGPFGPGKDLLFRIKNHNREQTCWALVKKLAEFACPPQERS
jgi:hypothetical protein